MISDNYINQDQKEVQQLQQQQREEQEKERQDQFEREESEKLADKILEEEKQEKKREEQVQQKEEEKKKEEDFDISQHNLVENAQEYGMNPKKVFFVRSSWSQMQKEPDFGVSIFMNFFKISPSSIQIFSFRDVENLQESKELKSHASKVVAVIDRIIQNLESISDIIPFLEQLGRDHLPFRVKQPHYAMFEQAILRTFEDKLGSEFDSLTREAWSSVYKIL